MARMGISGLQQSLEHFELSMKIAIETGDKLLELQISLGLGALFTLLRFEEIFWKIFEKFFKGFKQSFNFPSKCFGNNAWDRS